MTSKCEKMAETHNYIVITWYLHLMLVKRLDFILQ